MHIATKFLLTAMTAICTIAGPLLVAQSVPDQLVAKWTKLDPQFPDSRIENTLTLHAGTLEHQETLFDKIFPKGQMTSYKIPLTSIQGFSLDTFDYKGVVYRIGVSSRGSKDLVTSSYDPDEGPSVSYSVGMIGFAVFGPDQRALRDSVFKKLCDLIGQDPTRTKDYKPDGMHTNPF